jgi:UPF0755 protein
VRLKRFLVYSLLSLLIAVGVGFAGLAYWWTEAKKPVGGPASARVTVAKGEALQSVARELKTKGLIRDANAFVILAKDKPVKPGVYEFKAAEAPTAMIARMQKGDVLTVKVAFPEGFTLRKMADRLKTSELAVAPDAFLDLATKQGGTFKASVKLPANLEGYLFPATYEFPAGSEPRDVIQEMVNAFDRRVVHGLDADLRRSPRPLKDIVNVAAMVEREAETDADRPKIAGVIYNRIARGMPLQIDATVQYALPEHKSRLLYSDLAIDSPYNTYKVRGLPAGPICNPGLPSLAAALKPEKSDYLYYVAGPDGKSHLFARTFAEHQRNIQLARGLAPTAAIPPPAQPGVAPGARPAAPMRRQVARRRGGGGRRRVARRPGAR